MSVRVILRYELEMQVCWPIQTKTLFRFSFSCLSTLTLLLPKLKALIKTICSPLPMRAFNHMSPNDLFPDLLSQRVLPIYDLFLDVLHLDNLSLEDSYLHSSSRVFSFSTNGILLTEALSSSLTSGPPLWLDYQSKCSFSNFIATVVTTWFSNTNLLTLSNKKRKMNRIARYWIQAILMSCQNPGRYVIVSSG